MLHSAFSACLLTRPFPFAPWFSVKKQNCFIFLWLLCYLKNKRQSFVLDQTKKKYTCFCSRAKLFVRTKKSTTFCSEDKKFTEARTGRLRRELELLRSHPKDVIGALVPGASEGRQPPHFGEELCSIIHFLGEARGSGDIPFSGPPGDPVGGRIRTSFREHFGAHFGPRIELWSEGEIEHKREPKLGSS